jgi:acetolactate decarboxylase
MERLTCKIPTSLYNRLKERMDDGNTSWDHVVSEALSQYLGMPIHTFFQVSTSAALVQGLYQGAVRVSRLLSQGDFGIGTFIDLDGEMVVLDGVCYQVSSSGAVATVEGDRLVPYAVVTRYKAESSVQFSRIESLSELVSICDKLRASDNVFYAFRAEGLFSLVKTRVMNSVPEGTSLKAAASGQEEFLFENLNGTLVGLWSPGFAASFAVPGYHFHFLSADRQKGGHVLECEASGGAVGVCAMNEMHVSLPETEEFLKADLTRDPRGDLAIAERNQEPLN